MQVPRGRTYTNYLLICDELLQFEQTAALALALSSFGQWSADATEPNRPIASLRRDGIRGFVAFGLGAFFVPGHQGP